MTIDGAVFLIPPVHGEALEPSEKRRTINEVTPDPTWGNRDKVFENEVLKLVNDHRLTKSLTLLTRQTQLDACAGWKSLHMTNYNYMDHSDPAPPIARSTSQRFSDFGYGGSWGENIAYGYTSPTAVMSGWLSSAGHKANIENPNYRAIGVGAALKIGSRLAWTQCFGVKTDIPTPPPPVPDPEPIPTTQLVFDDRHAIGVYWPASKIPSDRVGVYIFNGTVWIKVRDQANTGDTFLTYPMSFAGVARVRIVGGGITIEGFFAVKKVSLS